MFLELVPQPKLKDKCLGFCLLQSAWRLEREEMEEMLYREEGGEMIEQYQYQSNYPGLVVGVS